MGVFTITSVSSVFAYIWLYVCLLDGEVTPVEAWLTLAYFFIMLICAYIADKCNAKRRERIFEAQYGKQATDEEVVAYNIQKENEAMHPAQKYTALETYNHLLKSDMK